MGAKYVVLTLKKFQILNSCTQTHWVKKWVPDKHGMRQCFMLLLGVAYRTLESCVLSVFGSPAQLRVADRKMHYHKKIISNLYQLSDITVANVRPFRFLSLFNWRKGARVDSDSFESNWVREVCMGEKVSTTKMN